MKFVQRHRHQAAVPRARDTAQVFRPAGGAGQAALHGPPPARQGRSSSPVPTGCSTPRRSSCSWAPSAAGSTRSRLLVAYGVANIAAAIPFTPGGLGVVELTLIGILVGFGPPRAIVILGVVGWRLVNFWLPIPVGGISLPVAACPPAGATTRPAWRSAGPCGGPAGAGSSSCSARRRPPRSPSTGPSLIDKVVESDAPLDPGPGSSLSTRAPRSPRKPRHSSRRPPDRALCRAPQPSPLLAALQHRLLRSFEHPVPSLLADRARAIGRRSTGPIKGPILSEPNAGAELARDCRGGH